MQTELAQIISLTSYGNEYIRNGKVEPNYFPDNTIFQFCNKVDFRESQKPLLSTEITEKIVTDNPVKWFEHLKKQGCVMLRLYYMPSTDKTCGPEYNLVGFAGGGGMWLIETNFGTYSFYWRKRWQVTQRDAADKKIWEVNYSNDGEKYRTANQQFDLNNLAIEFKSTLKALIDFCKRQNLKSWLEAFENAEAIFSDKTPNKSYYHYDLIIIKNYSLLAQQLLFSAGTSWVFGGMGSWNDMGFNDKEVQETYLQLSQTLYEQLIQTIIASTNSY